MTELPAGISVLHRDSELLVLFKPSGLATTSPTGENCLTEYARVLDPDASKLHASSRLDAEVTGAVTFARTPSAIAGLTSARKEGRYERFYLGLAARAPEPGQGEWSWAIDHDPRDPRRRIALPHAKPGQGVAAQTVYRSLSAQPSAALLLLLPQTGRTHQLRVHAAQAGVPLLGDRHYGGEAQRVLGDGRVLRAARVMLHCARVRLPDLAGRTAGKLTVDAPVPDDFRSLWLQLGGAAELLEPAGWPASS